MKKVLIAIPCMDNVSARFCKSLVNLDTDGLEVTYDFRIRQLIYSARNKLSHRAIDEEYDYIFFVDDDMTFQPDTLKKLIEDSKDIVSAVCYIRNPPHKPAIFDKDCNFTDVKKGIFEVGYVGSACILIKTKVLRSVWREHRTFYLPTKGLGEDLAFCKRARECGYQIFVDSDVKCGHMSVCEITEKDFKQ